MKRTIEDSDDEYVEARAVAEALQDTASSEVVTMAHKMVRGVLAFESKKMAITKGQLQKYVWEKESFRNVKFAEVFQECQRLLEEVFGYGLEIVGSRDGATSKKKTDTYVLVNRLSHTNKQVLAQFWRDSSVKVFQQGPAVASGGGVGSRGLPLTENGLNNMAFTLIVVSCVALSNNTMNRNELLKAMKDYFGLGPQSVVPKVHNGSENVTLDEYLKVMERNGYLYRKVEQSGDYELVEYSLGRRAKAEFDEDAITQFFARVLKVPVNDEFVKSVKLSLGSTFA